MKLSIEGYSEIIDSNFKEFCSIKETLDDDLMDAFLGVCSGEVKKTLVTQFGLSKFFDHFKDGGNVATVHNANKNIFPDKQTEGQFKEMYDRKNYDKELPNIRREAFKEDKDVKSYLTNKTLKKDGSTHADHIVSAKEIHSNDEARLYLNKQQKGSMAQSKENIEFLEGNINQSKSDKDLLKWKDTVRRSGKTNEEHYGIDGVNAEKYNKDARKFVNKEIRNHKVSVIANTGVQQGISMGKKQVIGMFIYEAIDIFFIMSFDLANKWKNSISIDQKISNFKETLVDSINITVDKMKKIKSNIVQTFLTGISSGFISNLLTFIINQFATTVKSLTKVLNDSIHALINAFKILVKRPKGMSFKDACKKASKIISVAVTASLGVVLTEGIVTYLLTTPLAPFAQEVGTVIGATITGIVTALVLYLMNNYREVFGEMSKEIKLVMQYAKVTTEQIEQSYLKTIKEIDEIYSSILIGILNEYKEVNRLMSLAYDFNQLSCVLFDNSIQYAEHLKVDKNKVLVDISDIDDFFLN